MRTHFIPASLLALAACGGGAIATVPPAAVVLPQGSVILDSKSGKTLATTELVSRVRAADYVLLGEYHDNGFQHQARGALLEAARDRHPAVVFEQFARSKGPIPAPADTSREAWLDANGFDRKGWKWPLHRPVVDAAIANGGSLWGSNMPREGLRAVVREGASGAPAELRALMDRFPLDSSARAIVDQELLDSHCGQLPLTMVPGMRAAQEVRDAAMTEAMLSAGAEGPAWLIAGNGHVRADIGVPRMLRPAAVGKTVLAVGFLERGADGKLPEAKDRAMYDIVVVTDPVEREDPCANFGK